ncbi:MAG: rhomboid family intramembrane serine protease [Verrucomicrobiota bacterium]|nr:rhomboid family intramembrane serine protease [Verrucomicrobiota bacterium]
MLEDRDYMRAVPGSGPQWPVAVWLIVANAVAFVGQNILYRFWPTFPTDPVFALSLEGLTRGYLWQLVTFQFMHGGLLHLLLNAFVIYVFGRALEEELGWRRFLALYFLGGFVGGLLQILAAWLAPRWFGGAVMGASAGAFALMSAFAIMSPDRPLTLLLFFVLPLTLKAKYLLLISALLALFGLAFPGDGIAHAAHLGGMLAGICYARWNLPWTLPRVRFRVRAGIESSGPRGNRVWPLSRRSHHEEWTDEVPSEEFLSREVDPILDKISAHGIHSLTPRERKILELARRRMEKR